MIKSKNIWHKKKLWATPLLRTCRGITTPPRLSVLVARSVEKVCVIVDFEADLSNLIYHDIRIATNADTVPFKNDVSSLCHLRWRIISIQDLDFRGVQIDRAELVIVVFVVLAQVEPMLLITSSTSLTKGCFYLTCTPPKYDATTLSTKHHVHLKGETLHLSVIIMAFITFGDVRSNMRWRDGDEVVYSESSNHSNRKSI